MDNHTTNATPEKCSSKDADNSSQACASQKDPIIAAILNDLPTSPSGILNLGMDGVLRSFDGEDNVLGYRQLSPEEIARFHNILPKAMREEWRLDQKYEGVDGRQVTDLEQLLHPPPEACMTPKRSREIREAKAA